jgi:PAS domain S-box-containing protein
LPIVSGSHPALFHKARGEVVSLLRTHDWESSGLGNSRDWPARLQHLVEFTFNTPLPSFILCGADRLIIYNGAFSTFCGAKHPHSFGQPFAAAFPEAVEAARHYEQAFGGDPSIVRDVPWPDASDSQFGMRTVDLELTPVTNGRKDVAWLQARIGNIAQRAPPSGYVHIPGPSSDPKPASGTPQLAIEDSEERLRLAMEIAGLAMWDWDIGPDKIIWSNEHFSMIGYEIGEVEPSYESWAARIHPEDLRTTLTALNASRDLKEPYRQEFRFLHPDGTVVWCSALGRFYYDHSGRPYRMVGVLQNISARIAGEERRKILVGELHHRTRNLVSLIQVLARKTLNRSVSMEDFRERFDQRLSALARVQALLAHDQPDTPVSFDEMLRAELSAHGVTEEGGGVEKVTLEGDDHVALPSATVQTFALAIHELATNATKYGALKNGGHLMIRWRVEQEEQSAERILHVEWLETGVAMPEVEAPPRGGGYGRELIEKALPYQLGAKTRYELGADGVRCTIALPV